MLTLLTPLTLLTLLTLFYPIYPSYPSFSSYPCLARGVSPLHRVNKESHLDYKEKETGHGMGRGKAMARARRALLYIWRGERLLLYTRGRVSLFPKEGMQTPSLYRIESVSTRYREERGRE